MHIALISDGSGAIVNEVAPILVFALAFAIALGGAYALAVAVCGWGHVSMVSTDFWRGQVKIQCK
jgi:hypothetical protein